VTDRKHCIAFFTFYDFLSVENMFMAKKIQIFGVKPIILMYSMYDESKNPPVTRRCRRWCLKIRSTYKDKSLRAGKLKFWHTQNF
jgi:hypothetical protein